MLIFKYGTMGSSKTANAIMTAYNFETKGLKTLFVKPDLENRDGDTLVKSRIGLVRECILWSDFAEMDISDVDKIIIDECHFLKKENIDYLSDIVDIYGIDVICFGLRSDFKTNLFEGSKRLFEIADKLEEIENNCWCGQKAIINARLDKNKNVVLDGDQIVLGGDNIYVPLCRKHYKEKALIRGALFNTENSVQQIEQLFNE